MPMTDAIRIVDEVMRAASRHEVDEPKRWQMKLAGSNQMGIMPGVINDPAVHGVKILSLYPDNPSRKLSSHQGVMVIFDSETGTPLACLDAAVLTAIRTAAASAVGTRALARRDATVVTLFGAGEQAEWHLKAMRFVRHIREIRICARTRDKAEALARMHANEEYACGIVVDPQEAVRGADIIVTTTSSKEPVLKGAWLEPGQHITLVGASTADAREIDEVGVARARYFVDSRKSASYQAGELLAALNAGLISHGHILAEIGDVLGGLHPGRNSPDEITIFKSHGVPAQDLATGYAIYTRAIGL